MKALCLGLFLLTLLGCSARQQLDIAEGGGGRAELEFDLPSYLLEHANAFMQNMPPGAPDLFDPGAVKKYLEAHPSIRNVKVVSRRRGHMKISWEFEALNQLLRGGKQVGGSDALGQTLRLMKMADGRERLELRLTRQNYDKLMAENPILAKNPIIQYYGPSVTTEASRDDYRDLIAFAFGPQAESALASAHLQLDITAPRPLLKVEGGSRKGPKGARFVFPLMDALYFKGKPVYAIEY